MKKIVFAFWVLSLLMFSSCTERSGSSGRPDYVLVIHGGAGTITSEGLSEERQKAYHDKLTEVLLFGDSLLKSGLNAVDVVERVVMLMEDCPLFNAGKGAVFTSEGRNEMDASIMEGFNHEAGAIGGVTNIKNPISAARRVMDSTSHVFLIGEGAERFAEKQGLEIVDPEYFHTERSKKNLKRKNKSNDEKHGTVGAVAMSINGDLAAATSTGGMTNKMPGRVGDSPVIGAGTYADNNTCAVSATGHGEFFMRFLAAYDVAALMKYRGLSLVESANYVIHVKFVQLGARGGLIAVDKNGRVTMPFNTEGMFRGVIRPGSDPEVLMFKKDIQ